MSQTKKKPKQNKKISLLKSIAVTLAILFVLAGARSLYVESQQSSSEEDYTFSQLVANINQEEVKQIVVTENTLTVTLQNDQEKKTRKEAETSLTESLSQAGVTPEKLNKVDIAIKPPAGWKMWLGTLAPILLPLLLIGAFIWFSMRGAKKAGLQALSFGKSKARLIKPEKSQNGVSFQDVAGLRGPKEELKEIVEFLKNPKKFVQLGAEIPKGVLLVGAPGTGKTLLSRATAHEASVPFFNVSGSEFLELFVGVGSSRVRDLFEKAKKASPAIIFIDELDAIGQRRGGGLGGSHQEREQTLNQILVEMDGFDPNEQVVVISATNRPDTIDPALLRPGRFDRRITLPLPDIKERQAILEIHSREKPLAKETDLRNIAERTPGFSGADLANLINEAAILSARHNRKQIGQSELRSSIEKVLLGPERKSHIISDKEKKLRAFHEAGHALAANKLEECDPVQKVSIISRGKAGGYTLKVPLKDKSLLSASQLQAEITVLLAGQASEQITFKEVTTGAANDLQKATHLTRKMVAEYGMSSKMGPIQYYDVEEGPDWDNSSQSKTGYQLPTQKNFSDKTAFEIDQEVKKIISQAQQKALDILTNNQKKLKLLAGKLIEKETIEKEEFGKMME